MINTLKNFFARWLKKDNDMSVKVILALEAYHRTQLPLEARLWIECSTLGMSYGIITGFDYIRTAENLDIL